MHIETVKSGDVELSFETGRMAKQASGAVIVRSGDTMVMVTAEASKNPKNLPFLPLTCEYIEKMYAGGRIPGSFFKREARPGVHEILVCRLMDRPCRPLFPAGWRNETQLIANVISYDQENAPDVLAITGASAALHISSIPWSGPLGAVRVGRIDGQFVANPTQSQREESECDLVVAASDNAIVMVEGEAEELTEEVMIEALMFGFEAIQPIIKAIEALREATGKEKRVHTEPEFDGAVLELVSGAATGCGLDDALKVPEKLARYARIDEVEKAVLAQLCGSDDEPGELAGRESEVEEGFGKVKKKRMRGSILDTHERIGGRGLSDVRQIDTEVSVLPRAHGSALFTRGETQSLVTVTLGTRKDEQRIDALQEQSWSNFMLHYNFPPFCVGEARMLRGTSRREHGHGTLAKRAITNMLPDHEDFPYTIRIVSEILESNGSSSMATVCGASLSLMDAGVKIKAPVAGVAMGLIEGSDKRAILTDILGDEDHLGDMDFKVCGTSEGITALQMDIKVAGLSREVLVNALEQAREARLHILGEMAKTMNEAREDLSDFAPRIVTLRINPDKIRDIIGPGGKTIRGITEQTGCAIDVEDDGLVSVASPDGEALQRALDIINGLTQEPEIGELYVGTVVKVVEFGAFVNILPNTDGLLHISEISERRTRQVEDVLREGDEVTVKVIDVDSSSGKIKLSRREAMADLARQAEQSAGGDSEPESETEESPAPAAP